MQSVVLTYGAGDCHVVRWIGLCLKNVFKLFITLNLIIFSPVTLISLFAYLPMMLVGKFLNFEFVLAMKSLPMIMASLVLNVLISDESFCRSDRLCQDSSRWFRGSLHMH